MNFMLEKKNLFTTSLVHSAVLLRKTNGEKFVVNFVIEGKVIDYMKINYT